MPLPLRHQSVTTSQQIPRNRAGTVQDVAVKPGPCNNCHCDTETVDTRRQALDCHWFYKADKWHLTSRKLEPLMQYCHRQMLRDDQLAGNMRRGAKKCHSD